MAATTIYEPALKDFITRLKKDFPQFKFRGGLRENWSPKTQTVTFARSQPLLELKYGLLHELAHALLEHKNYSSDLELVKMETSAWHLAAKLGLKYNVKIGQNHIQNCLDTYRDWLHKRSRCPTCGMHVIQQTAHSYRCFNCGETWRVSTGHFARPYRLSSLH